MLVVFIVMQISLGKINGSMALVDTCLFVWPGLHVCLWDTEGFGGRSLCYPSCRFSHSEHSISLRDSFPSRFTLEALIKYLAYIRVSQILLHIRITWPTLKKYRFWSHIPLRLWFSFLRWSPVTCIFKAPQTRLKHRHSLEVTGWELSPRILSTEILSSRKLEAGVYSLGPDKETFWPWLYQLSVVWFWRS